MRLIQRYLLRELAQAFGGVTFVLLLVTIGGTLTITLDRIARGKMPAALLLSQIGLRSLEAIALLLPLGVFLAVMLAYGRLYRDSEMAVISASGITARGLVAPVAWLALPVAALVVAYFCEGVGYIVTGTFLVAIARAIVLGVLLDDGREPLEDAEIDGFQLVRSP